ncbi:MAG: nucleoid occlusion factor SlmA [gamma proteobacterium symbiont of Bathyaustriella thionipta]|nr:nucleoid occlusion factor SlmA [gamma proteobacterium symbiont of Bathyaustriella thionipta]MCU7948955.1 nucleoid occlusion factor SlmA [gamma proteobacterium symbiont of Bathyaustriella thionipta]MCU7953770.1 nucleoid occlusion factor SlmA [gamma proteobacterium symbiont of Bathyaustriella thionipta]MCU7955444.1 nucleoid occlusion factor SlmA [gamma proteobacterium symbiont of Bathyaustriella thionipta]MCU7966821.1 nucleoid occlusion factor SlmA [gamma proteobacterium symbiont of Bathyaustr
MTNKKSNRKEQILYALALELEERPGERITTANLAKAVGVSEAALYRHFPSKAKMFEALIEFSEDAVFGLINQVVNSQDETLLQVEKIIAIILTFSAKNPGITRILQGDALIGEHERLLKRTDQFFERIETQLKQVLREGELKGQVAYQGNISQFAELLSSFIEGQLSQYVRSRFSKLPNEKWADKWLFFARSINTKD